MPQCSYFRPRPSFAGLTWVGSSPSLKYGTWLRMTNRDRLANLHEYELFCNKFDGTGASVLYYKYITIVNDESSVVTK